jgi:hypothetical protein
MQCHPQFLHLSIFYAVLKSKIVKQPKKKNVLDALTGIHWHLFGAKLEIANGKGPLFGKFFLKKLHFPHFTII